LIDKNTKKYKQVKINFYPEQHQFLSAEAKKNNQTIAQYIRQKLNLNLDEKEVKSRYAKSDEKDCHKKTDPKLIYQLNRIGNNLNQIARVVNMKKSDFNTVEILQSLVSIEKEIKQLI